MRKHYSSSELKQKQLQQQQEIREEIAGRAILSKGYLVMNALSAIIASYGLLLNSTAVVIGAMVVATLLGPIVGLGLGLADSNSKLLRNALIAEVIGMSVVYLLSIIVGRIHADATFGTEILSRTQPNLFDLIVALAGGAAGAYATIRPSLGGGLIGVAIATALVPPLATSGICLARGEFSMAFGAFILFLANISAILSATTLVLWLSGFHRATVQKEEEKAVKRWRIANFGLLLLLAVALFLNLKRSANERGAEIAARDALEQVLTPIPGAELVRMNLKVINEVPWIEATVRSPFSFTPKSVKEMEDQMPELFGKRPRLLLRAVLTKESTRDGYLHEKPAVGPEGPKEPDPVDESGPSTNFIGPQ